MTTPVPQAQPATEEFPRLEFVWHEYRGFIYVGAWFPEAFPETGSLGFLGMEPAEFETFRRLLASPQVTFVRLVGER